MERFFLPKLALSALLGVLAVSAYPTSATPLSERQARLAARYDLRMPAGTGPFPAVMLVPGCAGFESRLWQGHYERAAQRLKELGFVTIKVDYLAAAEASSCEVIMNPAELGDDVATAAKYLREQPYIRPEAVNLLAWSYGGVPTFHALRETESRAPVQVATAVTYYPYISLPEQLKVKTPVLVLCTKHDVDSACSRIETLLTDDSAKGQLRIVRYEDGYHGFDNSDLPAKVETTNGRVIGYKEGTSATAWAEVVGFLRR